MGRLACGTVIFPAELDVQHPPFAVLSDPVWDCPGTGGGGPESSAIPAGLSQHPSQNKASAVLLVERERERIALKTWAVFFCSSMSMFLMFVLRSISGRLI